MQLRKRHTIDKEILFENKIYFAYEPFLGEPIRKDEMLEAYNTHWRKAKGIFYIVIIKWILRK